VRPYGLARMRRKLKFLAAIRFLRDTTIDKNGHGRVGSVAGNFNSWFGIVGEVGGDTDLSMHSFVGGPRFSSRNVARATPFARLLVGAARSKSVLSGRACPAQILPFNREAVLKR